MSPVHDLVDRHIAAFNTQDADALLADFTPEATWVTGDTVAAEMSEAWSVGDEEKNAGLMAVFDLTDGKIARAKIYREGSADA